MRFWGNFEEHWLPGWLLFDRAGETNQTNKNVFVNVFVSWSFYTRKGKMEALTEFFKKLTSKISEFLFSVLHIIKIPPIISFLNEDWDLDQSEYYTEKILFLLPKFKIASMTLMFSVLLGVLWSPHFH